MPGSPIVPAPGVAVQASAANASISQGGEAIVTATVSRYGGYSGQVVLSVTGLPAGVTAAFSNQTTNGNVTTAIVTFQVSPSAVVGAYLIGIRATGAGIAEANFPLGLFITEGVFPCAPGSPCAQWAVTALASSEYTSSEWAAMQATGAANVGSCADDVRAWASTEPDGVDWLELNYTEAVRPTEIQVYETFAVSSIVKVEIKDSRGDYITVFTAAAGTQTCPRVLVVPVTGFTEPIRTVRVSIDQRTLRDWNEIDAVKLVGLKP